MNTRVVNMFNDKTLEKINRFQFVKQINWSAMNKKFISQFGVPGIAIFIFLLGWAGIASNINTSLGQLPGPIQVMEQFGVLYTEHVDERDKESAFFERQEKRNAVKLEKNPDAVVKIRSYTGKPTFWDQILTSVFTVLTGFLFASLIAIPIGILCG